MSPRSWGLAGSPSTWWPQDRLPRPPSTRPPSIRNKRSARRSRRRWAASPPPTPPRELCGPSTPTARFLGSSPPPPTRRRRSSRGRRIGIHPPATAPGCFCRIVLRRLGLDPDHDVRPVVMTPGDYSLHLRRLADGSLDAAFVGSTLAPEVTAQQNDLRLLALVGDYFPSPTVGVAVDPTHIAPDDPAVQGLVRASRRALRTIHDQPDLAARYSNAPPAAR